MARTPGMGGGGPCTSEREPRHPEESSGDGRARADDTSASLLSGAVPPHLDSSAGEAAVSRSRDGGVHILFFWFSTKSGMSPAVSRPLTEIVQHRRLLGLPCLQICLYPHRELHSCCSVLIQRTSTLLSSFTSIFS